MKIKKIKSQIEVKDILLCYVPAIVYNLYYDQNVFTPTVSHIHVCNKICLNQLHLFIIIHNCTETIMILFYKHCDNSHTCYISLRIIQDKDYALIPCMYIYYAQMFGLTLPCNMLPFVRILLYHE